MAHLVKVLAAKPGDQDSIPGTPWRKDRTDSGRLSSELGTRVHAWSHAYTQNAYFLEIML